MTFENILRHYTELGTEQFKQHIESKVLNKLDETLIDVVSYLYTV